MTKLTLHGLLPELCLIRPRPAATGGPPSVAQATEGQNGGEPWMPERKALFTLSLLS